MDDLTQLFKKIEDNIFDAQESPQNSTENVNPNIILTTEETKTPKKTKKQRIITEIKENLLSKLHLEKPSEAIDEESHKEKEEEQPLLISDEYADYGRMDKTGIHFQIISDINVSIEIVPDELLTKEVKELIIKYKGVFDVTMKLWLIPYVNYESLYSELYKIEKLRYKLHKVGSIAQEYYQNKSLQKLIIRRKKEDEILDYTTDKEKNPNDLPEKIRKSLYNFQVEGIKFGINHHCRFLLADEMGVGKTLQAISLAYIYRESWPVLVVCPGSMKYNWKGEIQTWLGLRDHRICIINSSKQKISQEAYFYIISYDLMRNVIKKMRQMNFDFVILDEAHSIKNKDSLRAKNILPVAVRAKRLIIMTGTPLLAKPYEGYPLLYALRPDIFCFFKKFAYRYCDPQPTPMGINWSGISNTKELHWILSCLMVRRLKREVLNQLPPKRRQKIWIKTDEKIIQELNKTRKLVKGRKGTLECYTLTSKAKINGVQEYISDIIEAKEKFIVFAYHHEMLNSLEKLCKDKGVDYIRIDGNTKQETRYQYVNYFQQNINCQVAILSIIAASTGITLTATHMVIFAELTWTPSIMIQAEDRVHRLGQKSEFVDIKYLYGKETLDDFILDKLQKKLTIVSTTLDDKKEFLGVKADQNFVNVSKKADFVRYDKGEICDEFELCDMDDMEKKMWEDLGETTGKKEKENLNRNKTVNKKNKRKKKKKNKNNKRKKIKINFKDSDSDSYEDKDDSNDKETSDKKKYPKEKNEQDIIMNMEAKLKKILKEDSTSRKKEEYPKENKNKKRNKSKNKSKRTASYSKIKSNYGSKISGIKELKKHWASNNKAKSVNKKTQNKKPLNNNAASKKSILTLHDDIINKTKNAEDMDIMKNERDNGIIIDKKKEKEINENENKVNSGKKSQEQEYNLNSFVEELYNKINEINNDGIGINNADNDKFNRNEQNKQYDNDLMNNIHDFNMRRTLSQESVVKTQKSLMEQIGVHNKEFQSENKGNIFNNIGNAPFKENIDENIIYNLNDKFPLI